MVELKVAQVVTRLAGKLGRRAEGEDTRVSARRSARRGTLLPAMNGEPSACSRWLLVLSCVKAQALAIPEFRSIHFSA